jgi:hypothetical protein
MDQDVRKYERAFKADLQDRTAVGWLLARAPEVLLKQLEDAPELRVQVRGSIVDILSHHLEIDQSLTFEQKATFLCPEFLQSLDQQYERRIQELRSFRIVANGEVINGIDGLQYPVPTLESVRMRLNDRETLEKIGRIPSPLLILEPFAMSLLDLAGREDGQVGEVSQGMLALWSWEFNSDRTGDLVYNPQKFNRADHGGKTKMQLLEEGHAGWNIVVMDGSIEIDRDALVRQRNQDGAISTLKNGHELLKESEDKGWDGLFPETYLIAQMMRTHQWDTDIRNFDELDYTRLTGAYLMSSNMIPSGTWGNDSDHVFLSAHIPEEVAERDRMLGFRAAVRR